MQKMSEAMKRFALYLRTDFKEIVNPSAMPNPPWHKNPPAKSFPEKIKVSGGKQLFLSIAHRFFF